MTRQPMISHLPHPLRLELNQRLLTGEPDTPLLDWLNGQQPADGTPVRRPLTAADLAAWKQAGYRDWLQRQDTAAAMREMAEWGSPGAEPATDLLAAWLGCRYVAESLRMREPTGNLEADWRRLREFCSDVAALRRLDPTAARLRLDRERFEDEARERKAIEAAERKRAEGRGGISQEAIERIERELNLL